MSHSLAIFERFLPFALVAMAGPLQRGWKAVLRWVRSGPAGEWPTICATIEVVSVVEQIREGRYNTADVIGYTASLTYFYRNPELQMGEYERGFPLRSAAERWAESFKNKPVVVHVNPKDPTDSVLLEGELDDPTASHSHTLEEAVQKEGLPTLERRYLILSRIGQLTAIAGLSLTATALWMRLSHSAFVWPVWMKVTVSSLVGFGFASAWLVNYRTDSSNVYQALLHSKLLCPAWMRWGVNLTGALVFALWLVMPLGGDFPATQHWLAISARFWSYLFLCWAFLSTGAMHGAIIRSQELVRRSGREAAS